MSTLTQIFICATFPCHDQYDAVEHAAFAKHLSFIYNIEIVN